MPGIYLLIAGTYTPFCLLVLSRGWAMPVLTIIWTGATAAILLKLFWPGLPKRASAAIGLALGWVAVVAFTQLLKLPLPGLLLVLGGGLAYTLGAITYARRRPDPFPAGARLPRGFPRADDHRRGVPVRGDRVLRPASGVTADEASATLADAV